MGANQALTRDDFAIEASGSYWNFVRYDMKVLTPGGRAAMVLSDRSLFEGMTGEVFGKS